MRQDIACESIKLRGTTKSCALPNLPDKKNKVKSEENEPVVAFRRWWCSTVIIRIGFLCILIWRHSRCSSSCRYSLSRWPPLDRWLWTRWPHVVAGVAFQIILAQTQIHLLLLEVHVCLLALVCLAHHLRRGENLAQDLSARRIRLL